MSGAVSAVRVQGPDMDIRTENAFVRITAYSSSIIRVRMSQAPLQKDRSYAVTGAPGVTSLNWEQTPEIIRLHTDSLELVIHKSPFSLSFLTRDGQVINEDEKGLVTSWQGQQVTTYKRLQESERFIASRCHHLRLVLHGFDTSKLMEQRISFLPGDPAASESVKTTVIPNDNKAISLQY